LKLIWLREESVQCLSCPEFQVDFIYDYASTALKVELRKLSRSEQCETAKVKHSVRSSPEYEQGETAKLEQIVRMEAWLASRCFDFVRTGIRNMLGRGFHHIMGAVIAELYLLRRQQLKLHFLTLILDSS
jgi:hypothetical protein